MKRWLLRRDGIRQRYNVKYQPKAKGLTYNKNRKAWEYPTVITPFIYQGETETAPSDPTDWEGEDQYEPDTNP